MIFNRFVKDARRCVEGAGNYVHSGLGKQNKGNDT